MFCWPKPLSVLHKHYFLRQGNVSASIFESQWNNCSLTYFQPFPQQHFGKFWVLKSINGGFACKTTNLFPSCCQIPYFLTNHIEPSLFFCKIACWDVDVNKFDTIYSQQFYSFWSCTPHICSVSFDSFLRWKYIWWI